TRRAGSDRARIPRRAGGASRRRARAPRASGAGRRSSRRRGAPRGASRAGSSRRSRSAGRPRAPASGRRRPPPATRSGRGTSRSPRSTGRASTRSPRPCARRALGTARRAARTPRAASRPPRRLARDRSTSRRASRAAWRAPSGGDTAAPAPTSRAARGPSPRPRTRARRSDRGSGRSPEPGSVRRTGRASRSRAGRRCARRSRGRRSRGDRLGSRPRAGVPSPRDRAPTARTAAERARTRAARRSSRDRLHLERVAKRPEEPDPDERLVEVRCGGTTVPGSEHVDHAQLELRALTRDARDRRHALLPLRDARDAKARMVGVVGIRAGNPGERALELRALPAQLVEELLELGDGRHRAEVERALVEVVAQAIAEEVRLVDETYPREHRVDALAHERELLGRNREVVVVPAVLRRRHGGILRRGGLQSNARSVPRNEAAAIATPARARLWSCCLEYDLKIAGGTLVDGTGAPARPGDVGIRGGRLVAVGDAPGAAARTIDARGHAVAPGFVDIHTHYDAQVLWDRMLTISPWHGVTTAVMGNCGFGIAPTLAAHRGLVLRTLERVEGMCLAALEAGLGDDWGFETFPEYLDAIDRRGTA